MEKRISKIVANISKQIAEECDILDHANKNITQSLDLYIHIAKHAKEYISVESCNYTIASIETIIKAPDFYIYNKQNSSLEYYKFLMEPICLVVKLTNKRNDYISSIYPVKEFRFNSKQTLFLNKKYIENFNEEEYMQKQKEKYDELA